MPMKIKGFRKKADASWDGGLGTGTGLFSTDTSLGFGYSGATEGLGNQTNLPPGHQGHSGNLAQGPWSGDSTNRERYKSEFVMKTIDDFTPEQLIQEIRNLVKIDTPESQSKAVYLKRILDDKMRRLKAAHEAYRTLNASKKVGIIEQLKQDPFVISLFAEHDVSLTDLDRVEEFPEELSHFALHKLVHTIEAQTTSQPFKGKCPESGKTRYMTHTEYVQNDFKANCPEGKRTLEDMKSVSIEEFKKKRKQKRKKKTKKAQVEPNLTFGKEEQQVINAVKEASKELGIKTYLVGGAVRDKLLGKENADMDFMCEDRAEELVAHLAKKYGTSDPVQYDRSQAMMVTLGDQAVDFINAEKLFTPLKKDESLEGEEEFTTSFDDAYRRDLTINTLMYDIDEDKLVDPTGKGLSDLQEGIINTVIDPFIKFKIHGADMLRALRFAATLGFELGPKMIDAMKANAERITPRDHGGDISNRRVRKELRKAIDTPEHWAIMRQLLSAAGLDIILAEDIQDVQRDFEGSIQYHWPEKEGSMRIKRFTKLAGVFDMFKKKEESLPALDKWLSKVPPKKTSPKSLDIQPASKDQRIQFIAKKLDEQLMTMSPEQQEAFVGNFLGEYKMGRGTPEYNAILSMLKNYKLPTFIPGRPDPKDKDIWRD